MVGLLGLAYYLEIHQIVYFIIVQLLVGIFEVRKNLKLSSLPPSLYFLSSMYICCLMHTVHWLARGSGSDGQLVWKKKPWANPGNMEHQLSHWEHLGDSNPIHLGQTRPAMVHTSQSSNNHSYY